MSHFRFSDPGTQAADYVATGTEGTDLPAPYLIGHDILLVTRNTLTLIPETPPVDSQGWYFDNVKGSPTYGDLILGTPLQPDEVIQILYV